MRKLKIWNGRWFSYYGQHMHIYACAHSVRDLNELLKELGMDEVSASEVRNYWSKDCWGNPMNGIEPERGIWLQEDSYSPDVKPKRILCKQDEIDLALESKKKRQ